MPELATYTFVRTVKISSWAELLHTYDWHASSAGGGLPRWVFRGQRSTQWNLKTSLERVCEEQSRWYESARVSNPEEYVLAPAVTTPNAGDVENFLLRKFRRECHRFELTSTPADDDYLEWFAWMQHYGAPTRLLDCTYSMFIAVFFAVEEIMEAGHCPAAVWAINDEAMRPGVEHVIRPLDPVWKQYCSDTGLRDKQTFSALFRAKPPLKLVGSVNAFKLNERLVIQQGVFLCPGDVEVPFMDNLKAVVDGCDPGSEPLVIQYQITDDPAVRHEILSHLLRMNITRATLFPGLDGFAKSLRHWLVFPELASPPPEAK